MIEDRTQPPESVTRMMLVIRLLFTLALLWFFLSGLFKIQYLILGTMSVLLVTWLSVKMHVLEHQGQPVYLRVGHLVMYWIWLTREIFRSNFSVAKMVLHRELPIKPTLRRVTASPDTEIGRVIYANSITLTPGTTAINFTHDGQILVHALHEDSLHELEKGEMADHVKAIEAYPSQVSKKSSD